jgi:uncharacterized protein (TIGR03435 family)
MIVRQGPGTIMRFLAAGIAIATILIGLESPPPVQAQSQAGAALPAAQQAAPKSFEVASIKPIASDNASGIWRVAMGIQPGGRYTASGVTASMLIQQAYDIKDYQISGAPGWLNTDRFDIVAKADTPNLDRETVRLCLQSLLAERFNLKIHRESKDLPIYNLVVGKTGHKLKLSETQPPPPGESKPPDAANDAKVGAAVGGGGGAAGGVAAGGATPAPKGAQMRMGRGQVSAQMVPLSGIAQLLAQQLGRPVIDKTDIKGNYDFSLQWTPDETQRGVGFGGVERPVTDTPLPNDPTGPSLFTAIQDQLGLRLEASKGPVDMIVIERIEKPSGN